MPIPLPAREAASPGGPAPRAPSPAIALADHLRARLVSGLHMGTVRAGDRLPSIRQVARESGVDHRAVSRAYRRLADEGLVEIQGRSGVRVAGGEAAGSARRGQPPVRHRWLAEVLAQSWMRSISSRDLRAMLEACTEPRRLRCACVESNRDQMLAYCEEIGELSGLSMVPVYVSPEGSDALELDRVREELRTVDLVVTTQYHAARVGEAMGRGGAPLVVMRINPELADAVRSRLRGGGMTVVAATPEFGERLRLMYADVIEREEQLRVVLAADADAVRRLDPAEPVLLSRAARELLPEWRAPRLVFPHSPTLAPDTIRELAERTVRLAGRQRIATSF